MYVGFQRLVLLLPAAAVLMNGAILTADYRFNGNLSDSLSGGTSLDDHGGTPGAGSYAFGAGQGLSVDNVILADGGAYTLALRFEFDTASTGWRKVVDFKDRTSDCGQYVNSGLNFGSSEKFVGGFGLWQLAK